MVMNNDFVLQAIQREFPDVEIKTSEPYGLLTLEIPADSIKKIIHYLKESTLDFNFLTDICGIHYPDQKGKELGVIYHLHSMLNNIRLRLKVFVPIERPVVDTLTDLYSGANWMERETYDFYGIDFKGHPDMRVILNMEDLGYHPLRKEYRLEDATREDKDDRMFGR